MNEPKTINDILSELSYSSIQALLELSPSLKDGFDEESEKIIRRKEKEDSFMAEITAIAPREIVARQCADYLGVDGEWISDGDIIGIIGSLLCMMDMEEAEYTAQDATANIPCLESYFEAYEKQAQENR